MLLTRSGGKTDRSATGAGEPSIPALAIPVPSELPERRMRAIQRSARWRPFVERRVDSIRDCLFWLGNIRNGIRPILV
jgi:hypothetical protein